MMNKFLISVCLWVSSLVSPASAYYFASGTYTGNGTSLAVDISDTTSPSVADFTPSIVIIRCDGAYHANWATSDSLSVSYRFASITASDTAITAMSSTGFTVGADAQVNTSSATCWYTAIGDDGSNDIAVGHYVSDTGSCSDDCDVTISPAFQPELVVLQGAGFGGHWRSSAMAGDLTCLFSNSSCSNNRIQALNADGFQYGASTNVNNNGTTYHYFAIKSVSGSSYTGSFTGNSPTDDRSITDPNFQPETMWVKANAATNACGRMKDNSGDESWVFTAAGSPTSDQIQSFDATGFTVGTADCANQGSTTMYYYVMKALPATNDDRRVIISD